MSQQSGGNQTGNSSFGDEHSRRWQEWTASRGIGGEMFRANEEISSDSWRSKPLAPQPPNGQSRDYEAGYAEGKADEHERAVEVIQALKERLASYEEVIRFFAPQEVAYRTIGNNSLLGNSGPEMALRQTKSERRGWRRWVRYGATALLVLAVLFAVFVVVPGLVRG